MVTTRRQSKAAATPGEEKASDDTASEAGSTDAVTCAITGSDAAAGAGADQGSPDALSDQNSRESADIAFTPASKIVTGAIDGVFDSPRPMFPSSAASRLRESTVETRGAARGGFESENGHETDGSVGIGSPEGSAATANDALKFNREEETKYCSEEEKYYSDEEAKSEKTKGSTSSAWGDDEASLPRPTDVSTPSLKGGTGDAALNLHLDSSVDIYDDASNDGLFNSPPCSGAEFASALVPSSANSHSALARLELIEDEADGGGAEKQSPGLRGGNGDESSEREDDGDMSEKEEGGDEEDYETQRCLDMQVCMFMIGEAVAPLKASQVPELKERFGIIANVLDQMFPVVWGTSTLDEDTKSALIRQAQEEASEILGDNFPGLFAGPPANGTPEQVTGRNDEQMQAKCPGPDPRREQVNQREKIPANGDSRPLPQNTPGRADPSSPFYTPAPSSEQASVSAPGSKSARVSILTPKLWRARKSCMEKFAVEVDEIVKRFAKDGVAAGEPKVLQTVRYAIEKAFDPRCPDLDSISMVMGHFVTLLSGMTDICRVHADDLRQTADTLDKTMPNFDPKGSYGELMDAIAKAKKAPKELPETETLKRAKMAIAQYRFPGKDKLNAGQQKKVDADVARFSKAGNSVLNLFTMGVNLSVAVDFCDLLSLEDLCSGDQATLDIIEELFDRVCPENDFDAEELSVKDYIVTVLFPALASQRLVNDSKTVAVNIRALMTDTKNSKRRELFCDKYEQALTNRADRNGRKGSKRSCVTDTALRREMANALFSLILGPQIEAEFPGDFFSKHGSFASTILRLAWRDLKNNCNRLTSEDFFERDGTLKESDDEYQKMKSLCDKKTRVHDTLAVVVFNKRQLNSLQELLKTLG